MRLMRNAAIGLRPALKMRGFVIAIFLASAFGFTIPIHTQVPASEHRLWVLDLGTVPLYRQLKIQGREVAQAASVVFVDANTLAVTYRIADRASTQATDAASFFDADSGAFRNSLQWPTIDRFSADRNFIRLLPTQNGEFLVVVGYSIRHYSAAHKELDSRALIHVDNNKYEWEWVVRVSPDGQTALIKRFGPGSQEDHWISTETLEDRAVAPAPFYGYGYGVGRGFVVYNTFGHDPQTYNQIRVHASTGEDRILCAECKGANFGIVNHRIFFGGLPAGTGVVTNTDGRVLLRKTFGRERQPVSQVSVARESTEIAFYMSYLRGKAISRIVVLDTATLREVRRFDFEDPGEQQAGGGLRFLWPIIAISPDGTKLALLWRTESADHHDKLEVFTLTHR
jgi:hypothetical protein